MAIQHVNGTIEDNLHRLDVAVADDLRVYCLADAQPVPYPPPTSGHDNDNVNLFGHPARYVGITNQDIAGHNAILVSDSFSPCVPVIATHADGTRLAHRNGSAVEFAATWPLTGSLFLLKKLGHAQQERVADALLERLQDRFAVKVVSLPVGQAMIGVIVKGRAVIVYKHKH